MADTKNLGTMVEDPRNPSGEKVRKDWLQAQEKNPVRPLSSDNKIIINPAGRSTESISGFKTPQAVSASDVLQQAQPQLQQTAKQLEAKQWLDGWFEKIEQEKQRALAMNEGRRIGTTLGALGRSIGELIQSTNNAPVLPNDIQKQYDALSADQQRIYDTYFARQDMLRKEKQAQDEAEKARQAAADLKEMEMKQKGAEFLLKYHADEAWRDRQGDQKDRELKIRENAAANRDENEKERLRLLALKYGMSENDANDWAMKASGKYDGVIVSNGKVYGVDKNSGQQEAVISAAYSAIQNLARKDKDFARLVKGAEVTKAGIAGAELKRQETVQDILNSDWLSDEYRTIIEVAMQDWYQYKLRPSKNPSSTSSETTGTTSSTSSETGGAY